MSKQQFKMPSASKINAWKLEHSSIHKVTVKISATDEAICILRHPKLVDVKMQQSEEEGHKRSMALLNAIWLDGDQRIKDDLELQKAVFKTSNFLFLVYPAIVTDASQLTDEEVEAFELINEPLDHLRVISVLVNDEMVQGVFSKPTLETEEIAALAPDHLAKGQTFLNQHFVKGDERLINGSDDEITFAACLAAHNLLKKYAVEVEKL